MNNEQKVKDETTHFINKIKAGFDPVNAFAIILARVIKEVEQESVKDYKNTLEVISKINPETDSNESNQGAESEDFYKAKNLAKNILFKDKKNKMRP